MIGGRKALRWVGTCCLRPPPMGHINHSDTTRHTIHRSNTTRHPGKGASIFLFFFTFVDLTFWTVIDLQPTGVLR